MHTASNQIASFRKSSILAVAVIGALMAASGASMAAPKDAYARGRVIIEARPGLSDTALDNILKEHGGKRRKLGQSRMYVVDLPGNASETAVAAALSHRPELKFAELDRVVQATATANDPYLGSEWHLTQVGATSAWDTTQGAGVTIAILDSGINVNHPDLVSRLVPGYNFYNNNTDLTDVCGHGTAVAGVAAASTNNATGVAGVAGAARLMPIRVAFSDSTTGGCTAYYSTIASGLTYAADNGARVANISYGGVAGSSTIMSAAKYMKSKGGLVFVSAGNSNIDENISTDGSMIAVSATTTNDAKASFSSWGNFVTLSAPGTGIISTDRNGGYSTWQGTSFSSPLSAGVAALVMAARPDLSGEQVQSILYSTAVDLGAAGLDPVFGYGRVNAAAAVRAAASFVVPADTTAPTASLAAPLAGSTVSGAVPVTVNASDNVGVARVDLVVNGTVVATDTTAPFSFSWDSTGVANGKVSVSAVAYDAAGNAGSASAVSVNVSNVTTSVAKDTTAPVVTITNPTGGTVNGNVSVSVNATDNAGAAGIKLTLAIDGATKAQGTGGSLGYNWNTKKIAAGTHTITVTARDAAGNTSTSSVNVSSR
ncbi:MULTISPECIES: S8 family serine peptidase [unclassified Massilia]|uniref:S8 family serine peptidase n=1 Tax=unclassified Massilia TaxID=2609279 RepID=UPI000A91FE2F|nr:MULTISPECIES: S8 family serine peptidase [unclassified Massilia]